MKLLAYLLILPALLLTGIIAFAIGFLGTVALYVATLSLLPQP